VNLKVLSVFLIGAGITAFAQDDPVARWRSGVTISVAAPQEGRHTIHSYFNTCPESPDGKWVLFFASKTANAQRGDVIIRNRATGEEKILARDIDTEDAHRIAYQQWVSGGRRVVYHGERDGQWFTAVVDVDTGKERILARDRLAGWSQPHADVVPLYGLHWNPGEHRGLELVNVVTGEISTAVTVEALKAAYPEFLAKLYGDKPVSIFFPILSPDLKRVFFKLATPAGGDARSSKASTRLGMVCYNLNDKRFLRADTRWGHPAWLPDARTIVEAGNLLIDSKTGETKRIPVLPGFGSGHPSVSPDAKLFVTDTLMERLGGSSSEWGVVVTDIEGTHLTVINRSPSGGGAKSWRVSHPHPIFSADGRRIYFNANNGPWTQLCIAEKQ
jgi:Tol biopolymer transport system component